MNCDDILDQITQYLKQTLEGIRGDIGQKTYKLDFFKLFRLAYNQNCFEINSKPRLTGDAIRDSIHDRLLIDLINDDYEKAKELLERLVVKWDE